jgi:mannose-6-phosphate isomerase
MIELLDCTVMPYAWGSRTAIAELTGRKGPTEPEAELWMGAQPIAPSKARGDALTKHIEADPEGMLGEKTIAEHGSRLPFLLKVLAAAEPLSLQAHPTEAQARAGFEDEERRGVPRDASNRNYKDPHHKPELICALTPFDALCGFRRAADTLALFDELAVKELEPLLAPLRGSPNARGLEETFRAIMLAEDAAPIVAALVDACRVHGSFPVERALVQRLAKLYPGDVGIISALLLNLVRLAPGEAIYLDAGNLHAYLEGTGIEIMASSDNVLRGGLTKKHVDVPELMRVLDFTDGPVKPMRARAIDAHERVYETPSAEFRLSIVEVSDAIERKVSGPEILFCAKGSVAVDALALGRGCAAFVAASTARYALSGSGTVYRARVNL